MITFGRTEEQTVPALHPKVSDRPRSQISHALYLDPLDME